MGYGQVNVIGKSHYIGKEILVRVKVPSYLNQTVILRQNGSPILNTNVVGTIESEYFSVNNSNNVITFLKECTVAYHFNGDDGFTQKHYNKGETISFGTNQHMLVLYLLP